MAGVLGTFNIGISGLSATGAGMSIISDNIANANTHGFKASKGHFQDVLATSLKGIDGGDQFGAGTKLSHISPIFTQGDIARTDNITDIAISGNGFFCVDAPFGRGFTRDGSFHFDREGNLVTADGYKILGFQVDENNKLTNKIDNIKVGNTTVPAVATSKVDINMNLDTRKEVKPFDITKPEETSHFSTSTTVYDNVGTARMVTLYFNKSANNTWDYHAVVDGKDAVNGKEGTLVEMAKGKLIFNNKGVLQEEQETSNSFNFNKGAAPGQKISFNFGQSLKEGGTGFDATTQYGSDSAVARTVQNGASAATMISMSFNDAGILTAVYNNGTSKDMGQISIGKFENNEGLFKVGKNLYKETRKSGQAAIGKPGEAGRGEVLSKSVELSNVDIGAEFIELMKAQSNFQANAKTIATADKMLQEVLNLKRT